jgi:nicotinate-nucleotide adenylyltransferase
LLVAQSACEELALTRLVFVIASQSPFKPDQAPAPASQRLRLLRLALAGHPNYAVDPQELERGGVSYTIDTARAYSARYPDAELFYLIGADHVGQLPKWREAEALAALVEFVVIPRPGLVPGELPKPFRGQWLKGFPLALSSTQVRARVRAGLPIEHLVPAAVAEAIRDNGLYFCD